VEPTNAPIFVSDFGKAWEYRNWPKAIMAFDGRHRARTYREIATDTAAEEIAGLMPQYPTEIPVYSGERIQLTRLLEKIHERLSLRSRVRALDSQKTLRRARAIFMVVPDGSA
jgi:hypothetical protein